MRWRVGVDIGGTFTDLTLVGDDGRILLWKEDTTSGRLEEAVERGLAAVAGELGLELGAFLRSVDLFVHGSTVATNAVITRRGPRVGLICTGGFRDVLLFRDGFKWDRYNPRLPRPADFVDRWLRLGVDERMTAAGTALRPLDEESVRAAARRFVEHGVESVAVALLWSNANPAHELRVREILSEELPGVPVQLSAEILPEIGEWVRTSATVLAAFVQPGVASYLRRLEEWLKHAGLPGRLLLMQVNGGVAGVEQSLRVPISLLASGPAAAPAAAAQVGQRVGTNDMITVDMGGTSFDICVIKGGETPRSRSIMVEWQPIGIPGVEVHSIGAGGGSIAWVDSGGALRVGPQSAGADPGPAAYGRGGTVPTVTDANVLLGYMSPNAFLGGRRSLRADLAEESISRAIAGPLGLGAVEAAAGIVRVVNANMVDAIRVVSVERGVDPRPLVLVAGGGAGALHAGRLAAELGMKRILVPAEAGTICAFGMTVTDVRHDYAGLAHTTSSEPATAQVDELLRDLEARALADLERSGFTGDSVLLQRTVDARYLSQVHQLLVPVPAGLLDEAAFAELEESFHRVHAERYTWSMRGHPVEYVHWRVAGIGRIERPPERRVDEFPGSGAASRPSGSRPAWFAELGGFSETPTFRSGELGAGATVEGPAILDSATTTVVVFPGQRLLADGSGSFLIELP